MTRAVSEFQNVQDELRRTNEELVEAREFLENVLESSTQYSIIAKDLERRIMAWNRGAARIYGYDASEVIGQSSDMLHVPEEVQSGAVAAAPPTCATRRAMPPDCFAVAVKTDRSFSRG